MSAINLICIVGGGALGAPSTHQGSPRDSTQRIRFNDPFGGAPLFDALSMPTTCALNNEDERKPNSLLLRKVAIPDAKIRQIRS